LAVGETTTDLIPSGPEAIQHFLINFLCYISIPIAIRYVFLRKPIENKWIAIGILVPIFIGFSILINIQRDDLNEKVNQKYGLQHKPGTHMIGSPMLYAVMLLSYFILRRGQKNRNSTSFKENKNLIEVKNNHPRLVVENNTHSTVIPAYADQLVTIPQHIDKGAPTSSPVRNANNAPPVIRPEISVDEEPVYAIIARELETGSTDKGLWIRLFAECCGDEQQMKILYIKQRAERLISSVRIAVEKIVSLLNFM
jgi:hypothetical protein